MNNTTENNTSKTDIIEANKKHGKIFTMENILCLFIIVCPILDVASFLFRNYFNTWNIYIWHVAYTPYTIATIIIWGFILSLKNMYVIAIIGIIGLKIVDIEKNVLK